VLVAVAELADDRGGRGAAADPLAESVVEPWLQRALTHWRVVTASALAMLVAALVAVAAAGRSFLPEFNEGVDDQRRDIRGRPGGFNALGDGLERCSHGAGSDLDGERTGRAELDEHVQGVESAEIDVRLDMKARPKDAVLAEIRERTSLLPGTNVTVGQPISHRIDHMLSGTRANIAVKVFGDDLQTLRELAGQVQAQMAQVEGVVDLSTEAQAEIPTLRVKVEADRAARYGIPSGGAAAALQTARAGKIVRHVLEDKWRFHW
jgi:Cu/Ag efflux pump CusA